MRRMKDSGVAWIGDLPAEWRLERLRFLSDIHTGDMDTQDNDPDGEYPFYVRSPNVERSKTYSFNNEAVLMAGDGVGAGKVFHYVKGKYGCHQRVYSITGLRGVTGKFLYYYLGENFYKKIEENSAKSTVDSVRLPMLKDFMIALPSLDEQKTIVSFLDDKVAKIDAVIAKQERIIENLRMYKKQIITEAVTQGLEPDVEMKESGLIWLDKIPTGWKIKRLSELCNRDITYGIVKLGDEDENGVKTLRCSDVKEGFIDEEGIRTVKKELSDEYKRTVLQGGEVVINVRGTLGGCAVISEKMKGYNIAREVAIVPVVRSNNRFVMYCLLSSAFDAYRDYSLRGVIYVGLNINLLERFMIQMPPIGEQRDIADYLDVKCEEIDENVKKRRALIAMLSEYKNNIVYETVTGKKEI